MADNIPSDRIQITMDGPVSRGSMAPVRRRVAALARYSGHPFQGARVTVRLDSASRGATRVYVADLSLLIHGRLLAAHALGPSPETAAKEACLRVRRQLRGAVGEGVARRNQSAGLHRAAPSLGLEARQRPATQLRPPQAREIVAFVMVSGEPESTAGAVGELIEHHHVFNLFRHRVTAEDVVVHSRDDENLVLLHPPGSALRDERDLVIPRQSRYLHPIPLLDARSEMDALGHRFVYFIAREDLRGKVLYLRRDGHYGLVQLSSSP